MIKEVHLKRFKRFEREEFLLKDKGLTICAGPNSSGKSTLLHALAVWSFGVTVVRQFKGKEALFEGYDGQGAGLSKDDFTPINIPDLRHLWYNLKSQLPNEGYSMAITVKWDDPKGERHLTMAFSLVQDRLFVKAVESNLDGNTDIPQIVYVPPVAGVDAREEYATLAKRRAMLGRGLAGAVLRNFLMDLEERNRISRKEKQGEKKKLSQTDLKELRASDPWERLNESMRQTFGLELKVTPFNADFHSVIRVDVVPKRRDGKFWRNNGPSRDLMVEGAGAQQWLTVLAFALTQETDVLLLDEPDAHLFTKLKLELVDRLCEISETGPQILVATHATEILKRHPLERIMSFGEKHPAYLQREVQRAKLISGLGDDYAPLIEKARISRRMLFVENESDARILKEIARTCGFNWPDNIAVCVTTDKHSDRLRFYRNLLEAIGDLKALSIRDRDNDNLGGIDPVSLCEKGVNTKAYPDFRARTWRRREIENYALVASALIEETSKKEVKKWWNEQGWAWPQDMAVEQQLLDCDVKKPLQKLLGKTTVENFLKDLKKEHIHADLVTIARQICNPK
jgi:predicted ATPase